MLLVLWVCSLVGLLLGCPFEGYEDLSLQSVAADQEDEQSQTDRALGSSRSGRDDVVTPPGPRVTTRPADKMRTIEDRLRKEITVMGQIPASQPASQPTRIGSHPADATVPSRRPRDLTHSIRKMVNHMRRTVAETRSGPAPENQPPPGRH